MGQTTYSFLDLAGAIAHPNRGAYTFTGEGVGEVTVTMSTDHTAHDVASDGSIMVSKISGNNGSVTISCQQTSPVHKWLLAWHNYLLNAPTDQWAQTTALLRNTTDGSSHVVTGVSPQKMPDKQYQAQGQRVSWTLMAANIENLTV
jgi:hypothetical protein